MPAVRASAPDADVPPASGPDAGMRQDGAVPAPDKARSRRRLAVALLAVGVVLVGVAGVLVGSSHVGVAEIGALLTGGAVDDAARAIVVSIRLPRVLAALLAGAALAVSGAIIQNVLDNPLASPNIIGVNAGAGLCVLLCSSLAPGVAALLPAAAFAGAVATALAVLGVASLAAALAPDARARGRRDEHDPGRRHEHRAGGATPTLRGGELVSGGWPVVGADGRPRLAGSLCRGGDARAIAGLRALDVMAMGEGLARGVGMNVRLCRVALMAVAALLAGAAVSFAGLVGFVGLVVPHMARFAVGNSARALVPVSALAGACVLCLCDLLARTLFAPYELPVGILMAFVGGPFFIWLVWRSGRGGGGGAVDGR